MIARDKARLEEYAKENPGALISFPCDVSNQADLLETLAKIKKELGAPSVVIHNAVSASFGNFLEINPDDLRKNFEVNTMSLLLISRTTIPDMITSGGGSLIATGNTAAFRGKDFFSSFAPTKAAQRILLESIARNVGPKGVHVGYVAIDAVIDKTSWARTRYKDKPDDFFCLPEDIAEEVFRIAHQPKSAWSFESVIRPFGEPW